MLLELARDMWSEGWFGRFMLLAVVCVFVLIPLGIWASIEESRQWETFKAAHECKVVGKKKGSTSTTVMPIVGGNGGVGIGVSTTPDQTAWECNDGVTYWR